MSDLVRTPWTVDQDNADGIAIVDATGDLVYAEDWTEIPHIGIAASMEAIVAKGRANAYRIVACVNACEGMDNPSLDEMRARMTMSSVNIVSRVGQGPEEAGEVTR